MGVSGKRQNDVIKDKNLFMSFPLGNMAYLPETAEYFSVHFHNFLLGLFK